MGNLSITDHFGDGSKGPLQNVDALESVKLRLARFAAPFCGEEIEGVVLHGRIWQYSCQKADFFSHIARFFPQFSFCRCFGRFALVHHSTRNLQRHVTDAMPKLSNQHDIAFRGDGDHVDPGNRVDDDEIPFLAAWLKTVQIVPQAENAVVGNVVAAEESPITVGHLPFSP